MKKTFKLLLVGSIFTAGFAFAGTNSSDENKNNVQDTLPPKHEPVPDTTKLPVDTTNLPIDTTQYINR